MRLRAKRAAWIIPSVPRSPKPPGTTMAWKPSRSGGMSASCSKRSLSIHSARTFTRLAMPPWVSASAIDL